MRSACVFSCGPLADPPDLLNTGPLVDRMARLIPTATAKGERGAAQSNLMPYDPVSYLGDVTSVQLRGTQAIHLQACMRIAYMVHRPHRQGRLREAHRSVAVFPANAENVILVVQPRNTYTFIHSFTQNGRQSLRLAGGTIPVALSDRQQGPLTRQRTPGLAQRSRASGTIALPQTAHRQSQSDQVSVAQQGHGH
jgi:hypothetical protein